MKKAILLSLFFCLIGLSVAGATETRKYAIKSGHITYELAGNKTGEKEVWFDDYGMKSYEEENTSTTIKMFGISNTEKEYSIMIIDGETFYDIDMISKTGYKGTLSSMEQMQNLAKNMTDTEQKQIADDIMESLEGQKLGTETFLGKSCEVMEIMGMKSWIYNGITLKSEANVMGIITNETATSFKENIKIPASKFDPPNGITYEDAPHFGDMFDSKEYDEDSDHENEENDEYYEHEEDTDVPVPITFDEFKSGLSGISSAEYTQTMVRGEDSEYMAMYMNAMGSMIMIIGSGYSSDNDNPGFENFEHNGKQMQFGSIMGGDSSVTMLLIHYPSNNLMISINSMTGMAKDDLIGIADKLKF